MLTIAYIGNGKSTNRYHLPFVLQRKDKIKVKKIFARHLEKSEWDRIPGVLYTDNINELLHDEEIDLIVICTRDDNDLHYNYAKMVLESNKHCLVEKPFMSSAA